MPHLPHLPGFVTFALLASATLFALYALRAAARARAVRSGTWLTLDVKGTVLDVPIPVPPLRRLLMRRTLPITILALRRFARIAGADPRVEGIIVRLGELRCGWATAASLRDVIGSLRRAGKRVVVFLPHGGGSREVYVAMAADKVIATPQSTLAPVGIAANSTFYRSFLARGGVEAESLARGEFKSAADSFTRDAMTEPNRMQLDALIGAIHDALVDAIAEGRNRSREQARGWVDEALFRGPDAVAKGLIDAVAYDDEVLPKLGLSEKTRKLQAARYVALSRPWALPWRLARGKRVAIVEVRGAIVDDAQVALGRVADATHVGAALRIARANPRIGAVVLFVDSPGGSALASDLIAREVERLREKKPVVAYFSNTAASGGYYVSAMANEIVAQPVTITGSIGVVALRFVIERTLEKLGLHHEVIRRGAHADMLSPYRHWTDAERALLDREIDGTYRDFVGIVARGRKRSAEEIEPLARGRVYAGRDALGIGLVDRLGGLDEALSRAATLASLPVDRDPVIIPPPRHLPEPAEPPPAVEPIARRLGVSVDLLNLALSCSRHALFAIDERLANLE